jgi:hypothetical protein
MMRPKARPAGMMKKKEAVTSAPMTSMRPKARPDTMVTPEEAGAIERGNRAAKRRADEAMPMMKAGGMMKKGYAKGGMMKKGYKKGGKIRGYGMARGGKVCKMR